MNVFKFSLNEEGYGNIENKYAFEIVYCFLPLSIQNFMIKQNGALLKTVPSSSKRTRSDIKDDLKGDMMWKIFVEKGKNEYVQIANQSRRPRQDEIELALYNVSASEGVLAKTVKFFKNIGK